MKIKDEYAVAYVEVLEVIKNLEPTEYERIPKERIELYNEYKDKTYTCSLDMSKNLEEQITDEAKAILSNLFIRFIANKNDKEEILQKQRKELILKEQERDYSNLRPLFKEKENTNKTTELVEIKEDNLFMKIFKKIRYFLWRNSNGNKKL